MMLALPAPDINSRPNRTSTRAVVALPQTSKYNPNMSTTTRENATVTPTIQVDADTQPRDYNELMDQFSLHQIIIRKG